MSVSTIANDIVEQFDSHLELDPEGVQEEAQDLQSEYRLPGDEIRRVLEEKYAEEAGIDTNNIPAPASEHAVDMDEFEPVGLETISVDGNRIDLLAEIDQLWEPNSGSIGQVGLIADDTARTKFTKWADSGLPEYDEGDTLRIQDAVVDEYQGDYSIELRSSTNIEVVDEDLDTGSQSDSLTVRGLVVAIPDGSGLIERCSREDCTRVLSNGRCPEHGDVNGEDDIRIKAVLDTGTETIDVIFDEEATTDFTGITLEEAKEMARDALDKGVVAEEIESQLLGRYIEVTGGEFKGYQLVDDAAYMSEISQDRRDELRSIVSDIDEVEFAAATADSDANAAA